MTSLKFPEANYWWTERTNVHEYISGAMEFLDEDTLQRREDNLKYMRLYGNQESQSLSAIGYSRVRRRGRQHRVTMNVVGSICDTITAKALRDKGKVTALTSGGDWSMQTKAKRLEKFIDGMFYSTKYNEKLVQVILDATIFGTGFLKIYEMGDAIHCERIFPNEIVVDDAEAYYGKPRQMFQRKFVDRHVLAGVFPEHKTEIFSADAMDPSTESYRRTTDMIQCVEAWHLRSSKDSNDGRHAIVIRSATLFDEPWDRPDFPFITLRWTNRPLGYWGQGIPEQQMGLQYEINKLLMNIQEQMHLSKPKVLLESGSKISKAQLSNEIWGIIEYVGQRPEFFVPKTVSGEVFSHLDRLFNRSYELAGVSQLSAQSKKPPGVESGVAIRELYDIESERFMKFTREVKAAEQFIGLAKAVDARGDAYEVISHGDKIIEKIRWRDINLEEDQYVLKLYPTSLLPTLPSARLQTVQEMAQAGMISSELAMNLLDFPDVEAAMSLLNAPIDDIKMLIDQMLEHGIYSPPEPFTNLELAIRMIQSAYLRAKINKAPEDKLELLRRYIEESRYLIQLSQAPPEMAAPGPSGGPLGEVAGQIAPPEAGAPGGIEEALQATLGGEAGPGLRTAAPPTAALPPEVALGA